MSFSHMRGVEVPVSIFKYSLTPEKKNLFLVPSGQNTHLSFMKAVLHPQVYEVEQFRKTPDTAFRTLSCAKWI